MNIHDYLIIGSGMSSVHAAQTLIENGKRVTLIDCGVGNKPESKNCVSKNFYNLRANDDKQYKYLLGDNLEGVSWGNTKHLLTPERQYIVEGVKKYLPFQGDRFNLIQSLTRGGLGNAWGAGACPYTELELKAIGLPVEEMQKSYIAISKRIGLSGCYDDADIFFNKKGILLDKPLDIDPSLSGIYKSYNKSKKNHNLKGVVFGRTPLAVISKSRTNRIPHNYRNMDFYDDVGGSVYRPWMTLDSLDKSDLFTYVPNALVTEFKEKSDFTEVFYIDVVSKSKKCINCKTLLIGAGVVGSARIVLRSFKSKECLPILTNGYSTKAFLHFESLGRSVDCNNNSLGQMEMFYNATGNPLTTSMASLYTYSSLMLSKLIKETPFLGLSYSRRLMAYIQSSLVIAAFNHPDKYVDNNTLKLVECEDSLTGDRIEINYDRSEHKLSDKKAVRGFTQALLRTGCIPLAESKMDSGSAVHYAGTMPFNSDTSTFYLNNEGLLNLTSNVYVIDGSGFKFLPANGISFSLMANADRIARLLIKKKVIK